MSMNIFTDDRTPCTTRAMQLIDLLRIFGVEAQKTSPFQSRKRLVGFIMLLYHILLPFKIHSINPAVDVPSLKARVLRTEGHSD